MSVIEYDHDFLLWTRQQAEALRRHAETRPNADIDWPHVIEEIEDLGSEQEHALSSYLRVALVHLLALLHSSDENPRRHWEDEILELRARIDDRLTRNPSLKPRLPGFLTAAYRKARRQAAKKLGVPMSRLPEACPFTLEQVLDDDWFPEGPSDEGRTG